MPKKRFGAGQIAGSGRHRFVMLRSMTEFSKDELTIVADTASSVEEFDLAELDRTIALLDHYKVVHVSLAPAITF
jgi:F-type H+-transporting ATPase subunit epsilon